MRLSGASSGISTSWRLLPVASQTWTVSMGILLLLQLTAGRGERRGLELIYTRRCAFANESRDAAVQREAQALGILQIYMARRYDGRHAGTRSALARDQQRRPNPHLRQRRVDGYVVRQVREGVQHRGVPV